ncbi:MAG TPA: transposase [Acetobacteraceae bacterium]|nr:transposase [Acetobacteraceae bacterium]
MRATKANFDGGNDFRVVESLSHPGDADELTFSRDTTGKPVQNAFIESFNGRLRDEFSNQTLFTSFARARAALEERRRDRNTVRPHSRIARLRPAAHAAKFSPQRAMTLRIDGSAPWPVATSAQMGRIAGRTSVLAG